MFKSSPDNILNMKIVKVAEKLICVCRKFQLKNYNTDEIKKITNVFGIIKGSVEPGKLSVIRSIKWSNRARYTYSY